MISASMPKRERLLVIHEMNQENGGAPLNVSQSEDVINAGDPIPQTKRSSLPQTTANLGKQRSPPSGTAV